MASGDVGVGGPCTGTSAEIPPSSDDVFTCGSGVLRGRPGFFLFSGEVAVSAGAVGVLGRTLAFGGARAALAVFFLLSPLLAGG